MTRFFPLENGIGHGSARVSVLFRPVQAILPANLLGFNIGTLVAHSVDVQLHGEQECDLSGGDVTLEISSHSIKLPRKNMENQGDDHFIWRAGETSAKFPVQQRYSTALFVIIKEQSTFTSGKKAMAVLWLRDIVDNERNTHQVALWSCKDYDNLKQNYLPPDGNLDAWNSGSEGMKRLGSVGLELSFEPGFGELHEKLLNSSDPVKRRLGDEVERGNVAGIRKKIGEQGGSERQLDPMNEGNTEVSQEHVEPAGTPDREEDSNSDATSEDDEEGSDNESRGLMKKLKDWKRHEHELHLHHRGVMQTKPARTAVWLKDNVKTAGGKVAGRFAMKTRQPDIETEA